MGSSQADPKIDFYLTFISLKTVFNKRLKWKEVRFSDWNISYINDGQEV